MSCSEKKLLMIKESAISIPSYIGHTPLVRLGQILGRTSDITVYAKLEMCSIGGSMKDRAAFNMIRQAMLDGKIKPGHTVVESSSGNMGIGLALACTYYGLKFICVVDERTNQHTIKLLKTLGAKIIKITAKDAEANETLLEARLRTVKQIVEARRGAYWTDQYSNTANPKAYSAMMEEIQSSLKGEIDYLFCATGTCGTIRGCSDYIKHEGLHTKVVAVDAVGSVIFGGEPRRRLIPGHGAAIRPNLFRDDMYDTVIHINEHDAVKGCRKLLEREAILAGGSSGAIIAALEKKCSDFPKGSTVVLILPDRGERYLDSIYNVSWLNRMVGI